jgi:hypothetical protein
MLFKVRFKESVNVRYGQKRKNRGPGDIMSHFWRP